MTITVRPVPNNVTTPVVEDGVSRDVITPYAPKQALVFEGDKQIGTVNKVVLQGESWWQPAGTNRYYEHPQLAGESLARSHVTYQSSVARKYAPSGTNPPASKNKSLKRGKSSQSSKKK